MEWLLPTQGQGTSTLDSKIMPFEFSGNVIREADDSRPARISLELQYRGDSPIRVYVGPVAPFSQPTPQTTDSPYPILFNTDFGPITRSDLKYRNGCWHFTKENIVVNSIANIRHLDSGQSLSSSYAVVRSRAGTCIANGEYTFTDDIRTGGSQRGLSISATLKFTGHRLSDIETKIGEVKY